MPGERRKTGTVLLIATLTIYALVRILEVRTGAPRTSIVGLEVLSTLAFALIDGARRYGVRGILVFAALCVLIGNIAENVGVATGFPFGHYQFLDLMGPRLFHVPILLGLAYVGMAYVSWVLACLILRPDAEDVNRRRLFGVSALASFVMVAWDWAQDPVWSTLLHTWRWRDGGPWFGVPLSNYFGWFLTVSIIYVSFTLYLRRRRVDRWRLSPSQPWAAVVFYGLCALGNALQVFTRLPQQTVVDAAGRSWTVAGILRASALVSIVVMGGFVLVAARRLRNLPVKATG